METTSPLPTTSAFRRGGLILLGLFPCLVSLGFHFAVANPTATVTAPERPALAFDQYAVNLGPIRPKGLVKAKFRFTNRSDRIVKITNLKPSCGCLQPRLDKREYAPGESGQFSVQVATAGEMPGPRHYTIALEYLDPSPQSVLLTFRLELPSRQLYIEPRAILVYQLGEEPVSKTVVVTDNRPVPATVTGIETRGDFIEAELLEPDTDTKGVQITRIEVTIKSVPAGTHNTYLKVRTDDPQFPVLNVPIRVVRQPPLKNGRSSVREDRPATKAAHGSS